jgi:hypothetical protein
MGATSIRSDTVRREAAAYVRRLLISAEDSHRQYIPLTTRRHIPQDRAPHSHRCEHFITNTVYRPSKE